MNKKYLIERISQRLMEYLQNVEILYYYLAGKKCVKHQGIKKKKIHSSNNNFNAEKRKPEPSVSCSWFEFGPG